MIAWQSVTGVTTFDLTTNTFASDYVLAGTYAVASRALPFGVCHFAACVLAWLWR